MYSYSQMSNNSFFYDRVTHGHTGKNAYRNLLLQQRSVRLSKRMSVYGGLSVFPTMFRVSYLGITTDN